MIGWLVFLAYLAADGEAGRRAARWVFLTEQATVGSSELKRKYRNGDMALATAAFFVALLFWPMFLAYQVVRRQVVEPAVPSSSRPS